MLKSERRKVLFLAAHPYLQRSRANHAVVEAVGGLEGVKIHRLYDLYPYFHIETEQEQRNLLAYDALVVQHPLYWYSVPALLKLWLDEVFESGWAYGPGGEALRGKDFQLSVTVGGPADAFHEEGFHNFPIETLLAPWRQTVSVCGMRWQEPLILHSSASTTDAELARHGARVRERVAGYLRDGEWR